MNDKYIKTHEYISKRWEAGLRTVSNPEYPLPYPFQPPCVDGEFKVMFYWDTFFTNRGMILDNHTLWAKYNTDNLIYLLDKYGCVPNSNSYPGIKHNSQPPYLHLMIKDIYNQTHDLEWLKKSYFSLKKEYDFWMNERMSPIGLNRHFHHKKTDQECVDFYDYVTTRIPELDKNAAFIDKVRWGSALNCDGESGQDFTPRYNLHGTEICGIDLNCNLYMMELNLSSWAKMFEPEMEEYYLSKAENRKALMIKYMFNKEDGLFYDYNFVEGKIQQTSFYFSAQFWPFICGISNDKNAAKFLLSKLEYEYGIACTTPYPYKLSYQAAYPYSWPYDNCFAFTGLCKLNMTEDAVRVAFRYMRNCANQYMASGHLWETSSCLTDLVAVKNEYPNTEMMGWTAGVYEMMYDYVLKHIEYWRD